MGKNCIYIPEMDRFSNGAPFEYGEEMWYVRESGWVTLKNEKGFEITIWKGVYDRAVQQAEILWETGSLAFRLPRRLWDSYVEIRRIKFWKESETFTEPLMVSLICRNLRSAYNSPTMPDSQKKQICHEHMRQLQGFVTEEQWKQALFHFNHFWSWKVGKFE